jgi:formate dehydrogenase subunit delta
MGGVRVLKLVLVLVLVAGRWSLVAGRWSLVAGRWSLVAGRWSLRPHIKRMGANDVQNLTCLDAT